ncbi:Mu transposase C-terminal domain-containing protein [Acrocarpospora sp. B8E8]|uniref:Mu transposase domain-containing protein n=1 Tax=Acrocarpospora sp. B8E8 TaxID=3153572 RepID=UPI00325F4E59
MSKGKIERFFRTVREQFLVEFGADATADATTAASDLDGLNRLLTAWIETDYHRRPHTSTGVAPLQRWRDGIGEPLPRPAPAQLSEAFKWSQQRTAAAKTALVSLHGNRYQVDASLAGRQVELVFDPFDLDRIEVRHGGRSYGLAVPFSIGRHAHPKARPERDPEPATPTGIDYLSLMDAAHQAELATKINYTALFDDIDTTTNDTTTNDTTTNDTTTNDTTTNDTGQQPPDDSADGHDVPQAVPPAHAGQDR